MIVIWVMMCPMDDTAFHVPLILSVKLYGAIYQQVWKSGCDINIMSYEYCLLRTYS